jgi:hypothetical protein
MYTITPTEKKTHENIPHPEIEEDGSANGNSLSDAPYTDDKERH